MCVYVACHRQETASSILANSCVTALEERVASLKKEVGTLKAQLQESCGGSNKQEEQIAFLKASCQRAQDRSKEKIEASTNFVSCHHS